MLDYVINNAKQNYKTLKEIINESTDKVNLINNLRKEEVIIEEYKDMVVIKKDELKIVVDTEISIEITKILVYNENFEEYVNLF